MAFPTKLSQLCTPAYIYFIISIVGMVIAAIQNMGDNRHYRLGMFSCAVPNCLMVFAIKVVYILFWTWVLNLICKDGHKEIAWFLVLLPFILLFVILGTVMVYQREGMAGRRRKDAKEGLEMRGGSKAGSQKGNSNCGMWGACPF